jgi:hypothetical protein
MTNPALTTPTYTNGTYSIKALCRLVGIACLAGFLIDLLVLTFPINLGEMQWRMGFLQQVGDRSIILLFGLALFMYGIIDSRVGRKRLAFLCILLGILFNLSSILVIRDSLAFQQQAFNTIERQESEVKSQIQKVQENPALAPKVTPEQLKQATQQLGDRVETLKQNAQTSTLKTSVGSVGNLVVVGLALLGLGQYGLRPPRD